MGADGLMIDRGKRSILGIGINVIDYDAVVNKVVDAATLCRPLSVSALAVHGVMTGVVDRVHGYRLNHLDLVVPDGQPVRWALKLIHGEPLFGRVYGPKLMLKICAAASENNLSVYLYGSSPKVLDRLEKRLKSDYPNLNIAGKTCSRFKQVDDATNSKVINRIRESGAKIVFVGLGCPRQEVFIFENAKTLSCPVLAVGAAYDFHAGLLAQAPTWMQDRGLEWLFRLRHEPRRLWRRYILLNPYFCLNLMIQWIYPHAYENRCAVAPRRRENFV